MELDCYPLEERIGDPRLLVGREEEFADYHKWIAGMPKRLSKSRVIIARKKCGKTAFVQRLFNQLWCANGPVIPFYIEIPEARVWYPLLALDYFQAFASQYISFLERDPRLVSKPLKLQQIKAYGKKKGIDLFVDHVDSLDTYFQRGMADGMWRDAIAAPHIMASLYKKPVLVIIDEFQNLGNFVYRDQACRDALDETVPGSYHELSESKIAPMLATGSEISRLTEVVDTYLEAGRLTYMQLPSYLTESEGLIAVYRYAEVYEEPITNEAALLINELCRFDPYFIACIIRSKCPDRDLTTRAGVIRTVDFETSDDAAEMVTGWRSWFERSLKRINQQHAKKMLLFLTRNPDRIYTAKSLKEVMKLDLSEHEIEERLVALYKANLIRGRFSNEFMGLKDGTFHLLLLRRLATELATLDPEADGGIEFLVNKLTGEKKALQNQLNQVSGRLAEAQLEIDMRVRDSFHPSVYFEGLTEAPHMDVGELFPRFLIQGPDGKKGEVDLRVDSKDCEFSLLIEVKKPQKPSGSLVIEKLLTRAALFQQRNPERRVFPAVLSLGGFTEDALAMCIEKKVGRATSINYIHKQWD
ncbi:MAG: hypothetical protein QNK37_12380 [Acidobacteriota bacterium]|nr:hypothetical protein [Acidobacteriota bacterium]